MNVIKGDPRPLAAVGAVVWRDGPRGQEVLLGKRKNSHGAGEWSFPGGKIDGGERPETAVLREVHEEVGCYVENVKVLPFWSFETYPELSRHFVTLYFSMQLKDSEIVQNMESEKCEGWLWFSWDQLPEPLFAGIAELRQAVARF